MALRTRTPGARALLPATRSRSSGPLGALLSSPALDVRLLTALQVLQVLRGDSLPALTMCKASSIGPSRHALLAGGLLGHGTSGEIVAASSRLGPIELELFGGESGQHGYKEGYPENPQLRKRSVAQEVRYCGGV